MLRIRASTAHYTCRDEFWISESETPLCLYASARSALLVSKIASVLTNDFFDITLVNNLATSAPRNHAWFGYCASLNVLDAKVLFSTQAEPAG